MLEAQVNVKSKAIRRSLFQILALLTTKYKFGVQVSTGVLDGLNKHEFLAAPLAELMQILVLEFENTNIVGDLLRYLNAHFQRNWPHRHQRRKRIDWSEEHEYFLG